MFPMKIMVGHYYTLTLKNAKTLVFAVLYGFERGKNKEVYTLRFFDGSRDMEFPIEESTFARWAKEGCVKEITAEEALEFALLKGA